MEKPSALLIAPPVYDFALFDLFLKPYALLKIGAYLEENGYDVHLINCLDYRDEESLRTMRSPARRENGTGKFFRQRAETPDIIAGYGKYLFRYGISEESFEAKLRAFGKKPDIVLVSSGMTYWYPGVREAVEKVRKIWPDAKVAVGGIYATLMPEHCERVVAPDFVIRGDAQGEKGLNYVFGKLGLPLCTGSWRDTMMLHPVLKDAAVIRINRGCPYSCHYCASACISSFEPGSGEKAFQELLRIHGKYGTLNFAFYDDALLINKENIFVPFLEMVEKSGLKFNFYLPNALHLDRLDFETASLMYRCGFREIRVGFESSDVKFHETNDNKLNLGTFGEKVDMLFRSGFTKENLGIYVLAGLPGQHAEEVEASIRYLAGFGLRGNIAEFSTVPGTEVWKECVEKSIFPLETEPVCHNNSIFPMQWEGFTMEDMARLKRLSKTL